MKSIDVVKARLMGAQDIQRTITRLARQVIESLESDDGVAIVGLHRRGVYLGCRLQSLIQKLENVQVPIGTLDVTMYRDDFRTRRSSNRMRATDIPFDVSGRHLILVDDVLYTGRTVRAAMDAVTDLGRPSRIQFLTLIDREHHELPIRADMVGRVVPTISREEVRVQFQEIDGRDGVWLVERSKD
ncbi:MAG: bifunctional pyr operon transcriptional regulator/uracil phosphoribosyltransferase PyrR [Bacteroidetes bacterium]|nr:bifunctional pyr operon transcriptional regulator/uracil phosphoribosyltransferase PyrR [Bacteroidota bacterium]MCY4205594.1 bifunctional pyr operon transcriptional regulator/uracil phosphoribosyltransferase PyrR [Bacteroidota bacterium]